MNCVFQFLENGEHRPHRSSEEFEYEILYLSEKCKRPNFQEGGTYQEKNDLDTTLRLVLRLDRKGDVIAQGLLSYEGRVPENFLRQYTL
jgi:hypothetical protein